MTQYQPVATTCSGDKTQGNEQWATADDSLRGSNDKIDNQITVDATAFKYETITANW
jgi:hypothetical protein